MSKPKNALIKQYQKLFKMDNVELEITKEALDEIVDLALSRKTGARGLRAILENIMMDAMFEVPSCENIYKCIITKDVVNKKGKATYEYLDAKKEA